MADHNFPQSTSTTPFPPEAALWPEPDLDSPSSQSLPGEPRIALSDRRGVNTFLHREVSTPLFDQLYPWIHLFAPKRGDNISSLHRQRLKGREIVLSEDPKLHMVWNKYKIYIKPIPACLLSHCLWESFLSFESSGSSSPPSHQSNGPPAEESDVDSSDSEHLPYPSPPAPLETPDSHSVPPTQLFDRRVALGFLRSYAYLIRHASDLKIAREIGLIPEPADSTTQNQITWAKWALFISHFQSIPDSAVCKRYHFGHLRLGRLDWVVRLRFISSVFNAISHPVSSFSRRDITAVSEPALTPIPSETSQKKKRKRNSKKIRPRWYYLQPIWSIPVLLEGLLTYFLFAFATVSLVLSAMQVSLAIPPQAYIGLSSASTTSPQTSQTEPGGEPGREIEGGAYILNLWRFFWVFSNATIYVSAAMCLGMLLLLFYPYMNKVVNVIVGTIWRSGHGQWGMR